MNAISDPYYGTLKRYHAEFRTLTYPKREVCMFEKKQNIKHQQDAKYPRKLNRYQNQSFHSQRRSPPREKICRKKLMKNRTDCSSPPPSKSEQKKEESKTNEKSDNQTKKQNEPPCSDLSVVSMDLGSDDESKQNSVKNIQNTPKRIDIEINTSNSNNKEVLQTESIILKKPEVKEKNNNTSLFLGCSENNENSISKSDTSSDSEKSSENIQVTASRDPRLSNKNDSNKEQDSHSSVFDSTNTDELVDPRIQKKVENSFKNIPLVLKVPNFWMERMKKRAERKQQGSGQTLKKSKRRNIKDKTSVCFTNLEELRKYTEIPIRELWKFCCHVSVRKDECKTGPLQNLSDSSIKNLIDTKKSYLTEADPAKKESQTMVTERLEQCHKRDEARSTETTSDKRDQTKETDIKEKQTFRNEKTGRYSKSPSEAIKKPPYEKGTKRQEAALTKMANERDTKRGEAVIKKPANERETKHEEGVATKPTHERETKREEAAVKKTANGKETKREEDAAKKMANEKETKRQVVALKKMANGRETKRGEDAVKKTACGKETERQEDVARRMANGGHTKREDDAVKKKVNEKGTESGKDAVKIMAIGRDLNRDDDAVKKLANERRTKCEEDAVKKLAKERETKRGEDGTHKLSVERESKREERTINKTAYEKGTKREDAAKKTANERETTRGKIEKPLNEKGTKREGNAVKKRKGGPHGTKKRTSAPHPTQSSLKLQIISTIHEVFKIPRADPRNCKKIEESPALKRKLIASPTITRKKTKWEVRVPSRCEQILPGSTPFSLEGKEEKEKSKPTSSSSPSMPEINIEGDNEGKSFRTEEDGSTKCNIVSGHSTPAEMTSKSSKTFCGEEARDVEYSLHIPEFKSAPNSETEQMSSEELIKVLNDEIENICRNASTTGNQDEKNGEKRSPPSSDSKSSGLGDASQNSTNKSVEVEVSGDGCVESKKNGKEPGDNPGACASPNTPGNAASQDKNMAYGENDLFADEGDEMLIQVRVIDNPEVKQEPEEEANFAVDLFGLQPEVKAEDPQGPLQQEENSNGICPISSAASPEERDVCGSNTTFNDVNAANLRVNRQGVESKNDGLVTTKGIGTNEASTSQMADAKESGKSPIRVLGVGDFVTSFRGPEEKEHGLPDVVHHTGNDGGVSKNLDNVAKQTLVSQNSTQPPASNQNELGGSTSAKPSGDTRSAATRKEDQTNTPSTAHNTSSDEVTKIANGYSNNGGQVPPIDVRRRVPQLSNLSSGASIRQPPMVAPQQSVTPDFAHRVYKVLNCYITANYRFGNLLELLESLNQNFNIEQDVGNIRSTAAKIRWVFGSMLLTNMRTLPSKMRNFDVFANYFMEFLAQMIQNDKSKPHMSQFVWELVGPYSGEYEHNDTLRRFRNFIENDLRVQQSLNDSGIGMTREQFVVLRSQVCQYVRTLKTSKQGLGQKNKSNQIVQLPVNQNRTNISSNTPLATMRATGNMGNINRPTVIAQRTAVAVSNTTNQNVTNAYSNMPAQIPNNAKGNQTSVYQNMRGPIVSSGSNNNKRPNTQMAPPNVNIADYKNACPSFQQGPTLTKTGYQQLFDQIPESAPKAPKYFPINTQGQMEATSSAPPQKKRNMGVSHQTMCNIQRTIESKQSSSTSNQLLISLLNRESDGVQRNSPENSQIRTNILGENGIGRGLQQTSRYAHPQVPTTRGSAYPCTSPGCDPAGLPSKHPMVNVYPCCSAANLPPASRISNPPSQCNTGSLYPAPTISNVSSGYTSGTLRANPPPWYGSSVANCASHQPAPSISNASTRCHPIPSISNASPVYNPGGADTKTPPTYNSSVASSNPTVPTPNASSLSNPVHSMSNAPPGLNSSTSPERQPTPNAPPRCNSASLYPTPPISNSSGQCSPYATPAPNAEQPTATEVREKDFPYKSEKICQDPMEVDAGITEISDDEPTDVKPVNSSPIIERSIHETSLNLKDEPDDIIDLTWLDDEDIKGECVEDEENGHYMDQSLLILHNRECLCGKIAEYLCSCNTVMYCSQECQFEDWINHQRVCPSGIAMVSRQAHEAMI